MFDVDSLLLSSIGIQVYRDLCFPLIPPKYPVPEFVWNAMWNLSFVG